MLPAAEGQGQGSAVGLSSVAISDDFCSSPFTRPGSRLYSQKKCLGVNKEMRHGTVWPRHGAVVRRPLWIDVFFFKSKKFFVVN